jgi:hypothetical protein
MLLAPFSDVSFCRPKDAFSTCFQLSNANPQELRKGSTSEKVFLGVFGQFCMLAALRYAAPHSTFDALRPLMNAAEVR